MVLVFLIDANGGLTQMWQAFEDERKTTLVFQHHGFGDGQTFAFWPMLFGGLFLYVSYYGCDQSQVQRQLSTSGIDATNQALLINGVWRFPLVLLYCLVGVGIAAYAAANPAFVDALPSGKGSPEYNLAVPVYMISTLPSGLVGLSLVALFAAAMSSLDSVLNSLSATTMEDFVRRFQRTPLEVRRELWLSRALTMLWGTVTLIMAFFVGDIAPTVLEAINKVGSLANGPILAVFVLGILSAGVNGTQAVSGLLCGVAFNAMCWLWWPNISWLWWNVLGFVIAILIAFGLRGVDIFRYEGARTLPVHERSQVRKLLNEEAELNWLLRSGILLIWFVVLFCGLYFLQNA
jgi:SSS family solute:Na+ symporter